MCDGYRYTAPVSFADEIFEERGTIEETKPLVKKGDGIEFQESHGWAGLVGVLSIYDVMSPEGAPCGTERGLVVIACPFPQPEM